MMWKIANVTTTTLVVFLMCIFTVPAASQNISEDLGEFSEVKTFNGVEVVIFPSKNNRIEISGHSKEKVKYDIVEDRLEIRLSLDNIWSKDNTLIKVYVSDLETIDANEGSFVRVRDVLKGDNFNLRVQEGAHIVAQLDASKLTFKAISGGRLDVEGRVEEQDIEVNSGGYFLGRDLRSKTAVVTASTAAKAELYVTNYCKATAKLGGVIEIFGSPDEVDQKTSLGGKIL